LNHFLKLIQTGATVEVADAVELDPALAEYRDPQGVSALLWAIYTGQTVVRDFLVARLAAHGVALDVFEAAAIGDDALLSAILDTDSSAANAVAGDGWTALHLAAAFGTPASVKTLLSRGSNVNAVSENAQRNQPLHAVVALGRNRETIEILLVHGANADATQAGGYTAIFSAAAANRMDLAELLLAHGANPHHKNDEGKTPAEYARQRGHAEIADWLESLPQ
jgi:ankyrin repeat protein